MNIELDPDLDQIADDALEFAVRIREEDPRRVFEDVMRLVTRQPGRATQILLALAAFANPDEGVDSLSRRVWAITDARVERIRLGHAS